MMHQQRHWSVCRVPTVRSLAEALVYSTWCGCVGFRVGKYLFLNDSMSARGAAEFGVFKPARDNCWIQVVSITFSWVSVDRAIERIRRVLCGDFDKGHLDTIEDVGRVQNPRLHGRCRLCA